ncbi:MULTISPECIES: 16S rRNA (guanine(527)-N(7))-methyltransferase RsmG [Clavibacter]|uniref:Ribosomal RNA small subunit methyltransferase G n=1 Tax=Clavibacter tessellarius TaxID=31965 RepID=A0A154V2T4_9MICO|nr:16S rRNA (guanine(527)-N(7))-methyltransferase RsmG [Clavibacter michiganensis]KZC95685.1 16S rRNA (guanine(527)-N(7))-methyltransferase RsmG [Clavibacter michiganensis subsp. tessellarius]
MNDALTIEAEPAAAAQLFGDQIGTARLFADDLGKRGEELGLIGPLEPARLWSRHILNSVLVAPLLRPGLVGDVGTGAGLPGLVLAIARPDVDFVLIEPMERRVAWLEEQVGLLGLTNVRVHRARAEEVATKYVLDQVTARAVSAFAKLIPLTVPMVRTGGELVLMKGTNAEREVEAASKAIRKYHLEDVEVITLGEGVVTETTRVIRARVE